MRHILLWEKGGGSYEELKAIDYTKKLDSMYLVIYTLVLIKKC